MYRLRSPLSVQFELTDACNNACLHCYNYWRYITNGKKLSSDDRSRSLDHFMSILQSIIDSRVHTLILTGGEPLLREDILFHVAAKAKMAGMMVGLNTNGVLIDDSEADKILEMDPDFVLLSLLSSDKATHNHITQTLSYEKTIKGIERLVERNVNMSVNMVVSKPNLNQVRETATFVQSLGVQSFSATPVIACYLSGDHDNLMLDIREICKVLEDLDWAVTQGLSADVLEPLAHCMFTAEERQRFSFFLDHRSCSAGISEMAISPDGNIRPCIHMDKVVGNVLSDGWNECWKRLEIWTDPALLPKECLECKAVDYCGGGCRMAALNRNSAITAKDPYMTEPITDISYLKRLPAELYTIGDNDTMVVCEKLFLREEDFGGIIFNNKRSMFVAEDPYLLFQLISGLREFTILDLLKIYQMDSQELRSFLNILIGREFLTLKERR